MPESELEMGNGNKKTGFDFEDFLFNFRKPLVFLLTGLILIGIGLIYYRSPSLFESPKVEIITPKTNDEIVTTGTPQEVVVEVSGAVEKPGVYKLQKGDRVDDLIILGGGLSALADRVWFEKNINRAAKLTDGQKIYILSISENQKSNSGNTDVSVSGNVAGINSLGLININSASQNELEKLPGIGPVYAQSIIEQRIYSDVSELLTKGALKKAIYEKIKDKVTVN